jgi:hypothetical protein
MIYIVAVFFTQSVTDHFVALKTEYEDGKIVSTHKGDVSTEKFLETLAEPEPLDPRDYSLHYFFQSLSRAILSLWQAMSGGLDWDTLAAPLFERVGWIFGLALVCFILFALLALMNVVTGVFVQTALLSAKDEEDSFMTSQIVQLFKIADKDHSATISWDEIESSLDDPSTSKEWRSIGVQAEDARYLFRLLDLEDSGEVSFEEFMGGCLRLSGPAKAFDLLTVMQEARAAEQRQVRLLKSLQEDFRELTETNMEVLDDISSLREELESRDRLGEGNENISGDDISLLAYRIGSEFAVMKSALKPLAMIEDLFRSDDPLNLA